MCPFYKSQYDFQSHATGLNIFMNFFVLPIFAQLVCWYDWYICKLIILVKCLFVDMKNSPAQDR